MRITEQRDLADQRVTEWFLREQARHQQPTAVVSVRIQPVITISRQFGASGHTVAEELAHQLGERWQVWDKQIIEQMAQSARVRKEMVETLDERTQSTIQQTIHNLFNINVMEPLAYRRRLAEILLALAQQGSKIILGRGANFVLPDALNVRLRAGIEHRTQAIMRNENIPHEAALRQVQQVDRDRERFTNSVFGRNVDDVDAYDMVLMTDQLGVKATAAAIIGAARAMFGDI